MARLYPPKLVNAVVSEMLQWEPELQLKIGQLVPVCGVTIDRHLYPTQAQQQ